MEKTEESFSVFSVCSLSVAGGADLHLFVDLAQMQADHVLQPALEQP
jgi:hypothetical protein